MKYKKRQWFYFVGPEAKGIRQIKNINFNKIDARPYYEFDDEEWSFDCAESYIDKYGTLLDETITELLYD